jgi:hypothetical protein
MAEAIVPPRIYYYVYRGLLGLALLTWGAFHLHLSNPLGQMWP